ncbi:EamA family transporter [Hymenobacter sp. BT559]|uniref:EamA family transporter n=1 Tax=Hymenobacter sp. BT559 TaxID=2795729 RepID=UPI0018EC1BBA|nr:EamA family transporter [Hymenobacter sp. BT559]MBJ6142412.1 EamA family transporter [Hymenobacter sp. BT559]
MNALTSTPGPAAPRRVLLLLAFAAVYLIWGSTYLAVKYAIATLPPLLMAGARFLLAGLVMSAVGRASADYEPPTAAQWRTSVVVGALLLMGGNGGVVLAERYIPSSLAALLVAVEPFWIVLLSWLWLRQPRPSGKVLLGLLLGFGGVYLLVGEQLGIGSGSRQLLSAGAVIGAAFCWAAGSLYGLRAPSPRSAVQGAGMQMLAGGVLLLVLGLLVGEGRELHLGQVSRASWLGFGYLVVFGSLVAFTAYSWLMKNAPAARVATYAYVNPVVAVLLGWVMLGEALTGQMLLGAIVIVGSVVLITAPSEKAG